jgi:uncharacterized protein
MKSEIKADCIVAHRQLSEFAMLTKDLLRYKFDGDRVVPLLLRPTPANLTTAENMLKFWRDGIGQRIGELEEAVKPVVHAGKSLVVGRGLQKLIVDACSFSDPESTQRLRREALLASAALMAKPEATSVAHRARIAQEIGLGADELSARLYGDLPNAALLKSVPDWNPGQLLDRYNLALCQGMLLDAAELDITLGQSEVGLRRRLLKALRFRRLLALVTADGEDLRLKVSGPSQIVDQGSRYGLQFALFLPALTCAPRWSARADVVLGVDRQRRRLELSDQLGLIGETAFTGYVPEEFTVVETMLREKVPEWRVAEARPFALPGGELVVPDVQITAGTRTIAIEFFHRWHERPLLRRVDQIARGLAPDLVIGVDRALAKRPQLSGLLDEPAFIQHGFLFSELPTARALIEAVRRVIGAATN